MTEDKNALRIDPAFNELLDPLAPGVLGYTVEVDGALYIPIIWSAEEGQGHVGRYLDSLPRDRTIRVPNVLSGKLLGMLVRRGFNPTVEFAEEFGEEVEVWERRAEPANSLEQPNDR